MRDKKKQNWSGHQSNQSINRLNKFMYPTSTLVNAIPTEGGGYLERLYKGKQIAHVLQRNFA